MAGSAEAVFAALGPVVAGIAETFGRSCEVVLHDYRDEEHSVRAIAGEVTGRSVGDAMSEIGLRVLAAGEAASNEVNYMTRTADGRVLKCSTLPLRDEDGALIGALCINIDVTALQRAGAVLAELAGGPVAETTTNFSGDLDQLVDSLVEDAERTHGMSVEAMGKQGRVGVVRALHAAGDLCPARSAGQGGGAVGDLPRGALQRPRDDQGGRLTCGCSRSPRPRG
ncbi:glycine-rich cell wall structural protein [Kutzneria sp. 744]|nr:glycine-rich cell wall structural protein [Kutzneria sp. 744]